MRIMWEVSKIKSEGEKRVRGRRKKEGKYSEWGREKVAKGKRECGRGEQRKRERVRKRVVFPSSLFIDTTESPHSLLKIQKPLTFGLFWCIFFRK